MSILSQGHAVGWEWPWAVKVQARGGLDKAAHAPVVSENACRNWVELYELCEADAPVLAAGLWRWLQQLGEALQPRQHHCRRIRRYKASSAAPAPRRSYVAAGLAHTPVQAVGVPAKAAAAAAGAAAVAVPAPAPAPASMAVP